MVSLVFCIILVNLLSSKYFYLKGFCEFFESEFWGWVGGVVKYVYLFRLGWDENYFFFIVVFYFF